MEQAIVYIGIDVAKAYLDVSWAEKARRFSNERSGHAALVRWLKTTGMRFLRFCGQGLLEIERKSPYAIQQH